MLIIDAFIFYYICEALQTTLFDNLLNPKECVKIMKDEIGTE